MSDAGKSWRLRGRTLRARLRRRAPASGNGAAAEAQEVLELDVTGLSGVFAAPSWLRDFGISAWLLAGVTLLVVGVVWLLSLTHTIVVPVIAAAIVASVASPLVGWMRRHGVPRGLGTALLLLALIALGAAVLVLVLAGIASQSGDISKHLSSAQDTLAGWLKDLGVDPSKATSAKSDASSTVSDAFSTLMKGVVAGLESLSSLVVFLSLMALSTFFLLKDGPQIRAWGERHLGLPVPVAHTITARLIGALRGYFLGVTIVAGFNALVVGVAAVAIGVPLAGTIAIVTFLGAYVPYLGAWGAGAFSVLVALGGAGVDAALAMVVVQLLANGVLQQMVQPVAYGTALGIHPLAVLIVTIAGGALFGATGLILAAPLVSAATRITSDLARARQAELAAAAQAEAAGAESAEPSPAQPG